MALRAASTAVDACDDHIDIGVNKFGGKRRQPVKPAIGISKLEGEVAPVQPTELLKALFEGCKANLPFWVAGEYLEHADAPHPVGRAVRRRQRPRRRCAA